MPDEPKDYQQEPFWIRVTSRKFIAYVVGMGIATVHLWHNPDSFAEWSTFALWLTGIYSGANVLYRGAQIGKNVANGRKNKSRTPQTNG